MPPTRRVKSHHVAPHTSNGLNPFRTGACPVASQVRTRDGPKRIQNIGGNIDQITSVEILPKCCQICLAQPQRLLPGLSKRAARRPRNWPRGAWETPKTFQNQTWSAAGLHFHALLEETLAQKAAGLILDRFGHRAVDNRHAPMCVSHHSCQCFIEVAASLPR